MGGFISKLKNTNSTSGGGAGKKERNSFHKNGPTKTTTTTMEDYDPRIASSMARYTISPFVMKRWSSMYIDEDGDVAHEFFIEPRKTEDELKRLERVNSALLTPQGYVEYDIPRLHPNLPYIMVEITS